MSLFRGGFSLLADIFHHLCLGSLKHPHITPVQSLCSTGIPVWLTPGGLLVTEHKRGTTIEIEKIKSFVQLNGCILADFAKSPMCSCSHTDAF